MRLPAHVAEDYRTTGLSLKAHPCAFFRTALTGAGCVPAARLKDLKDGARVSVGGLVLMRQRPGTAKGVVFMTLEDETGVANAVIWSKVFEARRRLVMTTSFCIVRGRMQKEGEVIHIVAESFTDLSARLSDMRAEDAPPLKLRQSVHGALIRSRDFH
jgi:error-prone DNA polymerase